MAFPNQISMRGHHVLLNPVEGLREEAYAVRDLVLAHAAELDELLPGVRTGYHSKFAARRRASRMAKRSDAEAFLINERIPTTRLIGQATLLQAGAGIQIDYWMFPSNMDERAIIGRQAARLLIARADEIIADGSVDGVPHAWLYEPVDGVDIDPSKELRAEMQQTDETRMPESKDSTAAPRPVRLWVAGDPTPAAA